MAINLELSIPDVVSFVNTPVNNLPYPLSMSFNDDESSSPHPASPPSSSFYERRKNATLERAFQIRIY
jgi:hypothetical protein